MNTTTYNGWQSYETWLVNAWLSNDEGTYHMLREIVESNPDKYSLPGALRDWISEICPLPESGLYRDMISAAFLNVDWMELAAHYLADFIEDEDEDEDEDDEDDV